MALREQLEKKLAGLRSRREEAEAEAGHAAEQLVRLASGVTPLEEVDVEAVRAAADTFADAVHRLKMLDRLSEQLRKTLM